MHPLKSDQLILIGTLLINHATIFQSEMIHDSVTEAYL